MEIDFKKAAAFLYQEFKDQGGMEWAKQQFTEVVTHTLINKTSNETKPAKNTSKSEPHAVLVESEKIETQADAQDFSDDKYFNEEEFASATEASLAKMAQKVILSEDHVADAVMNLISMAGEVRKFEEAQITKRVGIAAERDIAITQIKAQQELLQDYLNKSFDERAENFSKFFEVVDEALDKGNMQALAMGLESVIKLAVSSPFKDLRSIEETAAALTDPDHEWDF